MNGRMIKLVTAVVMLFLIFDICQATEVSALSVSVQDSHLRRYKKEKAVVPLKRSKMEKEDPIPTWPEVFERIQSKTDRLRPQMAQASAILKTIGDSLADKARSLKETNFMRATELAGLVGSVKVMTGSTIGVLQGLNGKTDPYTGLSIMASVALKDKFNQLIDLLGKSEDTRDIDCSGLKKISEAIYDVTKDIPNFILEEKDM